MDNQNNSILQQQDEEMKDNREQNLSAIPLELNLSQSQQTNANAAYRAQKAQLYQQAYEKKMITDAQFQQAIKRLITTSKERTLYKFSLNEFAQQFNIPALSNIPYNVTSVIEQFVSKTPNGKVVISAPQKGVGITNSRLLDKKIRMLLKQLRSAIRLHNTQPGTYDAEKLQGKSDLAVMQKNNSLSYAIGRIAQNLLKYGNSSTEQIIQQVNERMNAGMVGIQNKIKASIQQTQARNAKFIDIINSGNATQLQAMQDQYKNTLSQFSAKYPSQSLGPKLSLQEALTESQNLITNPQQYQFNQNKFKTTNAAQQSQNLQQQAQTFQVPRKKPIQKQQPQSVTGKITSFFRRGANS